MYVYIHIYIHIYIYIHVCVYVCIGGLQPFLRQTMSVPCRAEATYITRTGLCMYTYIYIYMYICMHVCVCINIYIKTSHV